MKRAISSPTPSSETIPPSIQTNRCSRVRNNGNTPFEVKEFNYGPHNDFIVHGYFNNIEIIRLFMSKLVLYGVLNTTWGSELNTNKRELDITFAVDREVQLFPELISIAYNKNYQPSPESRIQIFELAQKYGSDMIINRCARYLNSMLWCT